MIGNSLQVNSCRKIDRSGLFRFSFFFLMLSFVAKNQSSLWDKTFVMKFILVLLSLSIFSGVIAQPVKKSLPAREAVGKSVTPLELLTDDSTHWTLSTLSNIQYTNTTPGAYYNTTRDGGGMIVKFKFFQDGRYQFMFYLQVNTYGLSTETWNYVEGNVSFGKDAKGNTIFHTMPISGTSRYVRNGVETVKKMTAEDLRKGQTTTYIWERWEDPNDAKNDYVLMIDIGAHPEIDLDRPSTIDPSWISKFRVPRKN